MLRMRGSERACGYGLGQTKLVCLGLLQDSSFLNISPIYHEKYKQQGAELARKQPAQSLPVAQSAAKAACLCLSVSRVLSLFGHLDNLRGIHPSKAL